MTALHAWEALRACWIDTYLGPPDVITHDPGTNLASAEFKASAPLMGITCVQIPVEAHHSLGKVERYHALLRRAFEIITAEVGTTVHRDVRPQMSLKACNDNTGPEGYVPTLLIFGAYPRMTHESPPSQKTMARAVAVNRAMAELRKLVAKRKVNDALNTRNGPDTVGQLPASLPIGEEVLVYREPGRWTGPFKVIAVTDSEVTVDTVNGATTFRITTVKPYRRHPDMPAPANPDVPAPENADVPAPAGPDSPLPFEYPTPEQPRRRGRPRKMPEYPAEQPPAPGQPRRDGRPEPAAPEQPPVLERPPVLEQPRRSGRPRKARILDMAYLSHKERGDYELALELGGKGKIRHPGGPFEESDTKELDMLFDTGVLKAVRFDEQLHGSTRIFKSRMVREVKGKNTDAPYEKSRLVVQGYGEDEKREFLTQSTTIQRCSQRLLLALTPSLRKTGHVLVSRDITQAYPQSKSQLARTILVQCPLSSERNFPRGPYCTL
jgi:hypothetical protein